jgi:hypothetical protein
VRLLCKYPHLDVDVDAKRRYRFLLAASFAAAASSGCRTNEPVAPVILDASMTSGTWTEVVSVAGVGETWVVSVAGGAVHGTGEWESEACCGGTLSFDGVAHRDTLALDITYTQTTPIPVRPGPRTLPSHVEAVLDSPTDLAIVISNGDTLSSPIHFRKAVP